MKIEIGLTKRDYDCLLLLRKKPRTMAYLCKKTKTRPEAMNIMLSDDLRELYYVEDGPVATSPIILTHKGETIAQAEFDRRFDMYCTRVISVASLLIAALSLAISVVLQ